MPPHLLKVLTAAVLLATFVTCDLIKRQTYDGNFLIQQSRVSPFQNIHSDPEVCPPCFNCNLKGFECANFGICNPDNGICSCPTGNGGPDCRSRLCGSPVNEVGRPMRAFNTTCTCDVGWAGIDCNVCMRDDACVPLFGQTGQSSSDVTCYKDFALKTQNYMHCNVKNPIFIEALAPDRYPEATLTCNQENRNCTFQFLINSDDVHYNRGVNETFYCGYTDCDFSFTVNPTTGLQVTRFDCASAKCYCAGDAQYCRKNPDDYDELDLSGLAANIKGPSSFRCYSQDQVQNGVNYNCIFEEPSLADYGHIIFDCNSGECMYKSDLPVAGDRKETPTAKLLVFGLSVTFFGLLLTAGIIFWRKKFKTPFIMLPDDDENSAVIDTPTENDVVVLSFQGAGYFVKKAQQSSSNGNGSSEHVLKGVDGIVRPGELCAIMGPSGAGKSTFLDLLAAKSKSGQVTGTVYVNGRTVKAREMKQVAGFVDQEDVLMPTLTVKETLLLSANLRCPTSMTARQKLARVHRTMDQLGIRHLQDVRIGGSGEGTGGSTASGGSFNWIGMLTLGYLQSADRRYFSNRGLSGGEKRRVSIAQELVTSPAVLFLDEPTSGLDSYNAANVVNCLHSLATQYKRTVIMTIHQPKSESFQKFHKLVLLSRGSCIYSGIAAEVLTHFSSAGWKCPFGVNAAEFIIDVAMNNCDYAEGHTDTTIPVKLHAQVDNCSEVSVKLQPSLNDVHHAELTNFEALVTDINDRHLLNLVASYRRSQQHAALKNLIDTETHAERRNTSTALLQNQRARWSEQFQILSQRAWMNLRRNPSLLLTHLVMSGVIGSLCGVLFWNVSNDIAGFQNRLGLVFFLMAVFGFSSMSAMDHFAAERLLVLRERSNGFYKASAYYASKLIFDAAPLRLIPPIICASILYFMVGLNRNPLAFLRFNTALVGFNLVSAQVWLLIGIVFGQQRGVALLAGTMTMMYGMVFSGLLLNREQLATPLNLLPLCSFFFYTMEAILDNEMQGLTLVDKKMGKTLAVPSSEVLHIFGFRTQYYWIDILVIYMSWLVLVMLAWLAILKFARERR